jgi:hypothetical protein
MKSTFLNSVLVPFVILCTGNAVYAQSGKIPTFVMSGEIRWEYDQRSVPQLLAELQVTTGGVNQTALKSAQFYDDNFLGKIGIIGLKSSGAVAIKGDDVHTVDVVQRIYTQPFRFETRQSGNTWSLWLPATENASDTPTVDQVQAALLGILKQSFTLEKDSFLSKTIFYKTTPLAKMGGETFHFAANSGGILIWRRKSADSAESAGVSVRSTSFRENLGWFSRIGPRN